MYYRCIITGYYGIDGRERFRYNPKKEPTGDIFMPHERAVILVFWCQRSQRNSNGSPQRGAKERRGRLKRRFSTNIPGTADRLRRCQLRSPVSVINFCMKVGGNVDHTHPSRRSVFSS